jgi:hypothetical protein
MTKRRPSLLHFNLVIPYSDETTIDPIGSSKEIAKFQRPTLPLEEAVAKREGCAGFLYCRGNARSIQRGLANIKIVNAAKASKNTHTIERPTCNHRID